LIKKKREERRRRYIPHDRVMTAAKAETVKAIAIQRPGGLEHLLKQGGGKKGS